MMDYFLAGIVLSVGIIFYIFMAIAVHDFTIKKWKWDRYGPECFFAGLGWPVFILFWPGIGYPFIFVYLFSRRLLLIFSRKRSVSEVK